MNNIVNPFGIDKNGKLVHIDEAKPESETYRCPGCKSLLVVKRGDERVHHFAHKSDGMVNVHRVGGCGHEVETALHLFIKETIEKHKKLMIPPHKYETEAKLWDIDRVELEYKHNNIVPDVIAYIKGTQLFIEITVSHGVDEKKLQQVKSSNISMLEIDVSKSGIDFYNFDRAEVERVIIETIDFKRWLYNKKEDKIATQKRKQIIDNKELFTNLLQILQKTKHQLEDKYNCMILIPEGCHKCGGIRYVVGESPEEPLHRECSVCEKYSYIRDEIYCSRKNPIRGLPGHYRYISVTNTICPNCDEYRMLIINSKKGKFLGCEGYELTRCNGYKKLIIIDDISDLTLENFESKIREKLKVK